MNAPPMARVSCAPSAGRPESDVSSSDQAALVAALGDPGFYPHRPAAVEHVETHISHVFLAGPYAYKLKKAVRFPFLDARTADSRRALCEAELQLNWRLAAPVYLGVLPITRDRGGRLALDGPGTVVERVVWMRRLPRARMLDALAANGAADAATMGRLARLLADFHAGAPGGPAVAAHATPDALAAAWESVLDLAAPLGGGVLPHATRAILAGFARHFLATRRNLLTRRLAAGRIREGHGDLRAEHVCVLEAAVPAAPPHAPLAPGLYVVDCIEFSHALRCNDVASEVAFLAMDLERLGRPDLATAFVTEYAAATADRELRALLPFYSAYRAFVRGAVDGLQAAGAAGDPETRRAAEARARAEFGLAARFAWRATGPAVIACCGLSGTGKTSLAATLAGATGWEHLSTDRLRAQCAPAACPAPYGAGRYAPAARAAVYARLCAETDALLAAGHGVIADATFIRRSDRDALAAVARRHRRPVLFLECDADAGVVRERLQARRDDPSEARWDTYLRQRDEREPFDAPEPRWLVRTDVDAPSLLENLLPELWRWRTASSPDAMP